MKKLNRIFLLLAFLTIGFYSKGEKLTANAASVNITPPLEMKYTLGGYGERMNRPAEGIHDSIWAKALVLKKGNEKYAIITVDILGLPSNFKPDLLKRISSLGWKAENMMLLASHSHGSLEMAAINSKNLLNSPQIGIFQPELLEFVLNKMEDLIKNADQNYRQVKIGTNSKIIEGLNRNRRGDIDVDKELTVTRVDLTNGKPLAVLVNWTAHPTFIGGKEYGLDENTVKIVMDMLGPKTVGVGSFKIGDLIIAGVPGEMAAELGMNVKKSIEAGGVKHVAIGGLANEWISYILTKDEYINGGGYESSVSFYGPDLGDIISKEVINTALPLAKTK